MQGNLRGQRLLGRTRCLSAGASPSWLEVIKGPQQAPAEDATVMPVLPLRTIEWPGNKVELTVSDPAHVRMYQDLLASGRRQILAPLARGEQLDNGDRHKLHSVGVVLQLEDLKIVSEDAGMAKTYKVSHKSMGRAKILRLLNPSALYDKGQKGEILDYLQAEVEVYQDPKAEVVQTATAKLLMDSLEELRAVSERLDEPRLQSQTIIKQSVLATSTWQLMDLWQRLHIAYMTHREKVHVHHVLREWVERQQEAGKLPTPLPNQLSLAELDAPESVVKAFMRVRNPGLVDMGSEFWDRLLQILATNQAQQRWQLLLEWTQEEVNLALARASVKGVVG